ncbi:MAG: hypothetical protein ABL951_09470 [Alphaproteobacteria bacterium]
MTFNRLLTTFGAAGLGLTMVPSAMAGPALYSPPAIAGSTGLGFGTFIGTWNVDNSPDHTGDMVNPASGGGNAAEVGAAINAQYDPDLFDVDEFRLAGGTGTYIVNGPGSGFRVESILDSYTARWTYDGLPIGPNSPGMAPVDLYVAVKYSTYVSVFRFDLVDPDLDNDGSSTDDDVFGYFSSDFRTILANTADGLEAGLNYDGFDNNFPNGCILSGNNEFSADCMLYNPNGALNPYGVSHVVGYWPPVDQTPPPPEEVPTPGTVAMMLGGLLGLGYFGKRRAPRA